MQARDAPAARAPDRKGDAGIEDATPYTLRHTAATWMAQRGVPMWEIAGLMGHTSTRMVERVYAKHHPDHMQKATRALDGHSGFLICVPLACPSPKLTRRGSL